jgi:hypothetical protein
MKRSKLPSAIALTFLIFLSGLVAVPFLAIAAGGASPPCGIGGPLEVEDDGTPSILGPSTLTAADLRYWWSTGGRGQPGRLSIDIADLIALYLSEGDAEGVRGDMAFAQAVAETGHFTNSDTAINNFAGIAHYDHAASGSGFADPVTGVRAHIQLLKKYAASNDTALANPDVSPNAGAGATTWGGLAGTWASSPTYWTLLSDVYGSMLDAAGQSEVDPFTGLGTGCPSGDLALAGDYALPVERHWYDEHPEWFTKPHHDYPAADIPVPTGTPLYAVTNGVVISTPTSGSCGIGVIINGDDGAQYTYCHGHPGSQAVTTGDTVTVGQHLMDSASTGNSTGPHLHFAIKIDGQARCPQPLLVSIAEGTPASPDSLPTSGCSY